MSIDLWQTTAVRASGLVENSAAGQALLKRADILLQTQRAEDAVLRPDDIGAWPHPLRAALAARIANLNDEPGLAASYLEGCEQKPLGKLAEPSEKSDDDPTMNSVLAFMDRVASRPRDIEAEDIKVLQDAGVIDADIVRLCELNAFLGYQIRVIAGLRLLAEASV